MSYINAQHLLFSSQSIPNVSQGSGLFFNAPRGYGLGIRKPTPHDLFSLHIQRAMLLYMGRVAIVDDHAEALELFEFVLRGKHDFLTFRNGPEFLKEFRPDKFDLILLDLAMPGMDGFEVFRRIRSVDKKVPVVAITAMHYTGVRERALRAGFCDYFVKPISEVERFRQVVYSHVGKCANPPYNLSKNEPAA